MEKVAISLAGVEQHRAHFRLGPIDLDIPEGYVTAIIGPNGSGKSSTFRLLLDLSKPDAGQMSILGHPVGQGDDRSWKRQIGYLQEESDYLDNSIRGSEKATFIRKWYAEWDVNLYQDLLRRFEVDDSIKLGKMSKGMRRKFELALVIAHKPKLLLLDEPSSGLDPIAWRSMIDILHRYMEPGDRTILMASHIIDEVRRLADYIVFMARGQILGKYEKDELFERWHVLYVPAANDSDRGKLLTMPGVIEVELAGVGMYRIVSEDAPQTEEALQAAQFTIGSRQAMQLDEILQVLMQRGVYA
ncbi:ABC transporter ATP-binding protein [Paenibacillus sp. PR3]|uniref:ABC transporter ATP-binding protein n=1 Tax=Paenibacillus terricola TaxID=2763503 RepID=A0ABR8N2J0_9BACL|nr:ABC transporter ATP-binding protein [Paenibacillus terricola]MBD3922367.1 ABC transporter ATP-binding protein [Paenibacillus terricola]